MLLGVVASGCDSVQDDRIPSMPVSINLADPGLWNTYGVSGFGISRIFVRDLNIPSGFYTANTYTGYGGVLLIGGMDPFDATTNTPLAYDLSCPVECKRDIRVEIDPEPPFEAVCPVCHSRYDVIALGGVSVAGDAYRHKPRYGLRRYECLPGQMGGYYIRD